MDKTQEIALDMCMDALDRAGIVIRRYAHAIHNERMTPERLDERRQAAADTLARLSIKARDISSFLSAQEV